MTTCTKCGEDHSFHLTPGPTVVIAEEPAGDRWCFRCRKRLPHVWQLMDDPPERQPSYYEPVWVCRCSGCGEDRTAFPTSTW